MNEDREAAIRSYLAAHQTIDKKARRESGEALLRVYDPLIRHWAASRQRYAHHVTFDDLHQLARIGVLRAGLRYQDELRNRHVTLEYNFTYFVRTGAFSMMGKALKRQRDVTVPAEPYAKGERISVEFAEDKELHAFVDSGPTPDQMVDSVKQASALWRMLDRLNAREKEVVVLHDLQEMPFGEIGTMLGGMTKQRVQQIHVKAHRRLHTMALATRGKVR